MTTRPHARRPAGFTLIELLIVIGILAILTAISVATYFRVMGGQTVKNTEATLSKINTGLNRLWSANRDQADKEFRENNLPAGPGSLVNSTTALITFCNGDRDRAKSLWMYLRLKNEFPQNFLEAKSATTLKDGSGNTIVSLSPRNTFVKNSVINGTSALPTGATARQFLNEQAAALLYLIVTEKASRGEDFGDLATGAAAGDLTVNTVGSSSNGTFRVFRDGWGTPIIYVRYGFNEVDLNSPTAGYLKPNAPDPLDPAGRLANSSWTNGSVAASWVFLGTGSGVLKFPNRNWMMTAISAGANKDDPYPPGPYNSVDLTMTNANGLVDVDPTTDDILGYRTRREGQRGD